MTGRKSPLEDLERLIDYGFLDGALLEQAMTHSTAGEGREVADNRRLAFLGDAVIELALRETAHENADLPDRGALSKDVDKYVQDAELALRAKRLRLQDWLATSNGEAKNAGGEQRRLADAFEALAGAIYLDAGSHAFPVVRRMMGRDDATGE